LCISEGECFFYDSSPIPYANILERLAAAASPGIVGIYTSPGAPGAIQTDRQPTTDRRTELNHRPISSFVKLTNADAAIAERKPCLLAYLPVKVYIGKALQKTGGMSRKISVSSQGIDICSETRTKKEMAPKVVVGKREAKQRKGKCLTWGHKKEKCERLGGRGHD
jgi:hypothetical protein